MATRLRRMSRRRGRLRKFIYDDAVAGGNAAVIATRKKKEETLSLKLGNLGPGQEATPKLQIVNSLEVVGSHYLF